MSIRHSQCESDVEPQIITKMPGGDRLRRVTYFVSMCGKERSIGTSYWTHQPNFSSSTGNWKGNAPFLFGEHAHYHFTDPIDSLQLNSLITYFVHAHWLGQWNDNTVQIVAVHLSNNLWLNSQFYPPVLSTVVPALKDYGVPSSVNIKSPIDNG